MKTSNKLYFLQRSSYRFHITKNKQVNTCFFIETDCAHLPLARKTDSFPFPPIYNFFTQHLIDIEKVKRVLSQRLWPCEAQRASQTRPFFFYSYEICLFWLFLIKRGEVIIFLRLWPCGARRAESDPAGGVKNDNLTDLHKNTKTNKFHKSYPQIKWQSPYFLVQL